MDKPESVAIDSAFASDIGSEESEVHSSARDGAIKVTYLVRTAPTMHEQSGDSLRILIPADQAPFHATYWNANGNRQRVFVREPHVSVIPARQLHEIEFQRQRELLTIALDDDYYAQTAGAALNAKAPVLAERYAAVDPFLRQIGNTLRNMFRMQTMPGQAYLEALGGVIAIHLATTYGQACQTSQACVGLAPYRLNKVRTFIAEHLADAMHVQQLARIIHLSPYHFARMFKQATGFPPHLYLTMQRMQRAKELLNDSSLPLVDVAAKVGFQTQGAFTGVFHKHTGVTPGIFRGDCRRRASLRTELAASVDAEIPDIGQKRSAEKTRLVTTHRE